MSSNDGVQGVSNCYVFKSRLQEYAQKAGLTTPIYHTMKEGPSHQPSFRSTVILNNVRYDSLIGFLNRKAAEQSAAEVALVEIANSGATNASVSQPVHETGLCKNLLQEYAQKMNYAIPSYDCKKDEKQGRDALFSCTVDIGGIKYIGAAAKTKKEAELKAARTALLAIQMTGSESTEKPDGNSIYTVIPTKRKEPDSCLKAREKVHTTKPKYGRFKRRQRKRHPRDGGDLVQVQKMGIMDVNEIGQGGTELNQSDGFSVQVTDSKLNGNEEEISAMKSALAPCGNIESKDGHLSGLSFEQTDLGTGNLGIST